MGRPCLYVKSFSRSKTHLYQLSIFGENGRGYVNLFGRHITFRMIYLNCLALEMLSVSHLCDHAGESVYSAMEVDHCDL